MLYTNDKIEVVQASMQALLASSVKFEGKPLDYNEFFFWPFFWRITEMLESSRRIGVSRYILGGRQISKSTTTAGMSSVQAMERYRRQLYIAPQSSLAKAFSNIRLRDMLETPFLNRQLFSSNSRIRVNPNDDDVKIKVKDDVMMKRFQTGSYINIVFSDGSDTHRLRSYTADDVMADEAQSMDLPEVHHVAKYALRSSKNPRFLSLGTPLGEDSFSSAAENDAMFFVWQVKCTACNKWQDLRSLKNIDIVNRKIICRYCGAQLRTKENGIYIARNPEKRLLSLHANMLMLPSLDNPSAGTWQIIEDTYLDVKKTDGQKGEELLGVADSKSTASITKEDLNALPRPIILYETLQHIAKVYREEFDALIMGIDWGGDSDPEKRSLEEEYMNSHTSFCVAGVKLTSNGGRTIVCVLYEHVFPLEDPSKSMEVIQEACIILQNGLRGVYADFGGGFYANPVLRTFLYSLNPNIRFMRIQMLPVLFQIFKYDEDVFKIWKGKCMTTFILKMSLQEIWLNGNSDKALPEFYKGALAQRKYTGRNGDVWKKKAKECDDAFFSGFFAYLGALDLYGLQLELDV